MEESLDNIKLTKLFYYLYNSKVDVEFTEDEIDEFNNYISEKNVDSIIHLFESKETMSYEVFKDIIHSKVDSLWDFIMDKVNDKWSSGIIREEFLKHITGYEKIAVMFNDFDQQVNYGGLSQWDSNEYSDDFDDLYRFLENSNFDEKDKFIDILDNFSAIKEEIKKLDYYDNWYYEDCETRMNSLRTSDSEYYTIRDSWERYFEDYLIDHIPDEYKQMILNLNENINI